MLVTLDDIRAAADSIAGVAIRTPLVGTPARPDLLVKPESLQPVIVAEMETRVPYLSVGEAVMQMELAGAHLLVFRNEAHGGVNVVYMRDDGNIGWIDPRNTQ